MKIPLTLIASTVLLGAVATSVMADEVGPDEAVRLLEAGEVKPYDELNKIALAKHPGATIEETELEDAYGKYVYEVELRDASGQEWDVDIDATTGEVLKNRQDS